MKIIDAHIHYSNISSFHDTAKNLSNLSYSRKGLERDMRDNNVVLSIAMGLTETETNGFPDYRTETPMELDLEKEIPKSIVRCLGINPYKLDREHVTKLEEKIQLPHVVGFKIYLGYYPFYAYDEKYKPIYELAEKYRVPVVFHTGDTYSERGLLKYSHPLTLDEVAVFNREVTFVMAHFGDPWVLDGAEVVYKNRNMYADLSGLIVGTKKDVRRHLGTNFTNHLRHAFDYCDHYDKLLFGTDWPLISMGDYIRFIKEIIPVQHHEKVFYENALKVFPKINGFLVE